MNSEYFQAAGRVHRIGQTKPTFVHWFLVKGSIEENIHTLHGRRRKEVRSGVAASKEHDSLSIEDVQCLLAAKVVH